MDLIQEVHSRLEKLFPNDNINVDFKDERGDGKHFFLKIISKDFKGKSRIERSKMVYGVLTDLMKDDYIHALRMKLHTPEETV